MKYFSIEPEVAGGLGPHSVINRVPGRRTVVERLHYVFEGWLGDELVESTPCFIITERMNDALREGNLSGWSIDEVEISTSDLFVDMYPNLLLPRFLWLKVEGVASKDDFGIATGLRLVVSERALEVLRRIGIAHADVASFEPEEEEEEEGDEKNEENEGA